MKNKNKQFPGALCYFGLNFLDHDSEMVDHIFTCLLHVDGNHQNVLRVRVHESLEEFIDGGEGSERGEFLEDK